MGIRIHKKIGYFIPTEKFEGIIKSDYKNILENLDYDKDNIFQKFLREILTDEHFIWQYLLKDKSININNFISLIYNCDDFHGLLFQSPDLNDLNRHDNNIDYYENRDLEMSCEFKLLYINSPIYPESLYYYNGVPNDKLKIGEIVHYYSSTPENLIPCHGSIVYQAAMVANIIENITEFEFCKAVRPAIITHWG